MEIINLKFDTALLHRFKHYVTSLRDLLEKVGGLGVEYNCM